VRDLAERGFPVELSEDGRVSLGPDTPLHPEELRQTLRTRVIGRRLEVHREVSSTQVLAREAVRCGAPPGLVVVAEYQSEGRGRMGRRWLSPPGQNLLCSLVVSPPEDLPPAALTITSAVAVAEALAEAHGVEVQIRWPNDILVEGKKGAGILVEATEQPTGERALIIGVGVNVNAPPGEIAGTTALREPLGQRLDRTLVLVSVLEALDHWYEVLLRGQAEEIALDAEKRQGEAPRDKRLALAGIFPLTSRVGNYPL